MAVPDPSVSLALQRQRDGYFQLLTFIQQSGQAVAMLDTESRYIAFSPRWCEVFSLASDELPATSVYDSLPELAEYRTLLDAARMGTLQTREEDLLLRPDGSRRWIRWQIRPWHGPDESVGGISILLEDISERVRIREQLAESERFLRMLLDTLPQSIFWKDSRGRFLGVNRAFHSSTGVRDVLGRTDYEMPWSREQSDFFRDCDLQVMQTRQPLINIVEKLTVGNGETRWLTTSKVPLVDTVGKVTGVLGTFLDITHIKEAESVATLNLQRLTRKLHAPVQQLAVLCQQLEASGLNASQEALRESLRRCADCVLEGLREGEHLALSAALPEPIRFDVEEVAVTVLELLAVSAQEKDVELWLDGPPASLLEIEGYPERLHQVLIQLLADALQQASAHSSLLLRIAHSGTVEAPRLRFSVEGVAGLSVSAHSRRLLEEQGASLLERAAAGFEFPLKAGSRGEEPGFPAPTKVGVFVANPVLRGLIEDQLQRWGVSSVAADRLPVALPEGLTHGIADVDIWLQREARDWLQASDAPLALALASYEQRSQLRYLRSQGVQAVLFAPLLRPRLLAQALHGRLPLDKVPHASSELPFSGKRLLVAEDTLEIQEGLAQLLTAQGCEVEFAGNGLQALDLLEQHAYDMILLDCVMPELNGFETAAAMRQTRRGAILPIVGLTTHCRRTEEERCLASGMDDCLAKPVQAAALQSLLQRYLTPGGP